MLTADLRGSPVHTNICLIAGLSISCDSCTEALTISTCVTWTGVRHTVIIIWVWMHLREQAFTSLKNRYDSCIPHYKELYLFTPKSLHLYLAMADFEWTIEILDDATLYFCPFLSFGGLKAWVVVWFCIRATA